MQERLGHLLHWNLRMRGSYWRWPPWMAKGHKQQSSSSIQVGKEAGGRDGGQRRAGKRIADEEKKTMWSVCSFTWVFLPVLSVGWRARKARRSGLAEGRVVGARESARKFRKRKVHTRPTCLSSGLPADNQHSRNDDGIKL